MRRTVIVLGLGAVLLGAGIGPAAAAPGEPQRPAGQVTPVTPSDNGGDNGWGNCGHNSSKGKPHTGTNGAGGGNGGYKKGDDCGTVVAPPTDGGGDTGGGDDGGIIIT